MSKHTSIYACTNCDAQFPKWTGQCTECGKWGSISQSSAAPATAKAEHRDAINLAPTAEATPFTSLSTTALQRRSTGIPECDRVLGGGIVPGSLTLLGGDPGIGKSTLVAQIAGGVSQPVLYVSGEESGDQIKLRLNRLGVKMDQISFLGEEHIEAVCKTIMTTTPALVIIDSIQTVASSSVDSEPGSVNQIKACTVRLLEVAKQHNIPIMIIGHVTKGGELGGPKTLEHIVDTVLYLEGDRHQHFRILRSVKNRFGATNEIGVFDMQAEGLHAVENPSEVFLQERTGGSGSCMTVVAEGNRLFLLEVQALVNKTSFGYPQRKASGFDLNRLNVLLAVLVRRARLPLDNYDVYINIVGGVRFSEPAMDVAVCAALASALHDVPLPTESVAWGEVGLGGEIRKVSKEQDRTKEAKRFGLTTVFSAAKYKQVTDVLRIVTPE